MAKKRMLAALVSRPVPAAVQGGANITDCFTITGLVGVAQFEAIVRLENTQFKKITVGCDY